MQTGVYIFQTNSDICFFSFNFSFCKRILWLTTAQNMKFSIKDSFSKCDQVRRKLRISSHLLKKSLMENLTFCAVNGIKRLW